jgi:predicted regulator of Ras-like GTPase activity (Roadblock/LC7/MglB family)
MSVTVPEAETLLAPIAKVDGFKLACLIDASTGMILGALGAGGDIETAAAGASDLAAVLTLLTSRLATGEFPEDVMVTLSGSFFVVHLIDAIVVLVILDRSRTNLALARRTIRDFCARLAS